MSTAAKTPNYNLSQVAGSDIPDWITDYTSDMKKIDEALKGNADDIATVRPDEFSEESTYAAGDYCIKDNVIYKAKTAVEAGAFDISDWTATTIFDELSGLNQNISNCYDKNQVDGFLDGYKFRILQAQLQFANGSAIWEDDLSDLGGALYFASVNGLAVNDTFAWSITNGTAASARLIVWELNTPGFSGAVNIRILVVCK